MKWISAFALCLYLTSVSAPVSCVEALESAPQERVVKTDHTVVIDNQEIPYQATAGTQSITDSQGKIQALIFYTSYAKQSDENLNTRPILFCFNGGPGSSSVWLHLGAFGPQCVAMDKEGMQPLLPYQLKDNPYSLLDIADLVFIDPVSTGYSSSVPADQASQLHGVDADIDIMAQFIRLYVTRHLRWESPKFVVGESYGTLRAAGLAYQLYNDQYLYLDGIILLSSILDFQTLCCNGKNDLPYILSLPSYTVAALYHDKISLPPGKSQEQLLKEVEDFALGEYATALLQGNLLPAKRRQAIAEKLSNYIGLSQQYIENANLRISYRRFSKELLRNKHRVIGYFDCRVTGIEIDGCQASTNYDPSLDNVLGVFTATLNTYMRKNLNWYDNSEYKILTSLSNIWDWNTSNQYASMVNNLSDVINKNPSFRVFVGSGIDDIILPYFATKYTLSHMDIDPAFYDRITSKVYEGGHMMYLRQETLTQLKKDLTKFLHPKEL